MKNIIYTIVVLTLFNCGALPRYKKDNFKPISNAKQIDGIYKNYVSDSLRLFHKSLNGKLNWRKKDYDSTKFTATRITVLDKKRLKLDFQINTKTKKSKILKYRLRNNGFIKLRNKNFKIAGIPMVFGGYEVRKHELGLDSNNNLILNSIDDSAGGMLIIISGGRSVKSNTIHERI